MDTTQERETDGRYTHSLDTLCACGHRKGAHSAERVRHNGKTYQECFEDGCECDCFHKPRKK